MGAGGVVGAKLIRQTGCLELCRCTGSVGEGAAGLRHGDAEGVRGHGVQQAGECWRRDGVAP